MLEKYKGKDRISEIKALLLKDINAKNKNGSTALMGTSYYGHTDIVEALIESGGFS